MYLEEFNMILWLILGKMSFFEIFYCFGYMISKKSEILFILVLCFCSIFDDILYVLVVFLVYYI